VQACLGREQQQSTRSVPAMAVSFPMWADSSGPFFLLERFLDRKNA